jgi:CRISPR/Cas system-associated exonuclease Cas4 (RecB family)
MKETTSAEALRGSLIHSTYAETVEAVRKFITAGRPTRAVP